MRTKSNTPNRGFQKAYDQLPAGVQGTVRSRIQRECEWYAQTTFYAKVRGAVPIKKPEWNVLEIIFDEYGIDVHTGKQLKIA